MGSFKPKAGEGRKWIWSSEKSSSCFLAKRKKFRKRRLALAESTWTSFRKMFEREFEG